MRKICVTSLLLVIFFFSASSQAHAWFGWLDNLSGPGPFFGPHFEMRLVCFGQKSNAVRLLSLADRQKALLKEFAANRPDGPPRAESIKTLAETSQAIADELRAALAKFPAIALGADVPSDDLYTDLQKAGYADKATSDKHIETLTTIESIAKNIETMTASTALIGVMFSSCANDRERRASIEVASSFLFTLKDDDYANNQRIFLNMLMPSFSFRVFKAPGRDFLDAGVAAGVYWFSSEAFKSFSGLVVEPAFLELHPPSTWRVKDVDYWKRFISVFSLRAGLITFPAGFESEVFVASPDKPKRFRAELRPTATVFINVPFFGAVNKQ